MSKVILFRVLNFLVMACCGLLWFIAATGMKQLKKSKSFSFKTTITCEQQADDVAEQLINMPGVIEATLVHAESVAYLKVDEKTVDFKKVKSLLKPNLS